MPITYEETALAFAQQFIRAQQAEAKVKELQGELAKLKNPPEQPQVVEEPVE